MTTEIILAIEMIAIMVEKAGGCLYFVGGCVRDEIMGRPCHDHDFLVVGLSAEEFERLFPQAVKTGNAFPVYRMKVRVLGIVEAQVEFALARTERKCGTGHNGFKVAFGKEVTLEEDLMRRDTTMNALTRRVLDGKLIDPFGGQDDIRKKVVRAVSEHFTDDPIRALRAARQAAQFGFTIEENTRSMMRGMLGEIQAEPKERIIGELVKALGANRPSVFFRELRAAGLLGVFPHVAALVGKTQPSEWHPEGDAFEHTMMVLDEVATHTDDLLARFCALAHDFGKGQTPADMLPKHIGHDKRGGRICREELWKEIPSRWRKVAAVVCEEHMRVKAVRKPAKIVEMAECLKKTNVPFNVFKAVCDADSANLRRMGKVEGDPWWFTEEVFSRIASTKAKVDPSMDVATIKSVIRNARVAAFKEMERTHLS